VHLAPTIDTCWSRLADTAFDRDMRFENQTPKELVLKTDETCLNMILANLLDNAITYGDEGGGSGWRPGKTIRASNCACPTPDVR
jgi:signal transduction histidine kinase